MQDKKLKSLRISQEDDKDDPDRTVTLSKIADEVLKQQESVEGVIYHTNAKTAVNRSSHDCTMYDSEESRSKMRLRKGMGLSNDPMLVTSPRIRVEGKCDVAHETVITKQTSLNRNANESCNSSTSKKYYQVRESGASALDRYSVTQVAPADYQYGYDSSAGRSSIYKKDTMELDMDPNKYNTDILLSEVEDQLNGPKLSNSARGSQIHIRCTEIKPLAVRAKLGIEGLSPSIKNIDPQLIKKDPSNIVVTNFQVNSLRLNVNRTRGVIGKRCASQITDRERPTDRSRLTSQPEPMNSRMEKLYNELCNVVEVKGQAIPMVKMDLLPEFANRSDRMNETSGRNYQNSKSKCVSIGVPSSRVNTAAVAIQNQSDLSNKVPRNIQIHNNDTINRLPKWRFERGQMRLNSQNVSPQMSHALKLKEYKPSGFKGIFAKKHKPEMIAKQAEKIAAMTQLLKKEGNNKNRRKFQRTLNQLQINAKQINGNQQFQSISPDRTLKVDSTDQMSLNENAPKLELEQWKNSPLFESVLKHKGKNTSKQGSYQLERFQYVSNSRQPAVQKIPQDRSGSQYINDFTSELVEILPEQLWQNANSNELPKITTKIIVERSAKSKDKIGIMNRAEKSENDDIRSSEPGPQSLHNIESQTVVQPIQNSVENSQKQLKPAVREMHQTSSFYNQNVTSSTRVNVENIRRVVSGNQSTAQPGSRTITNNDREPPITATTNARILSQVSQQQVFEQNEKHKFNVTLSAFENGMTEQGDNYVLPPMNNSRIQTGTDQYINQNNPIKWHSGGQNLNEQMNQKVPNQCLNIQIQASKHRNFALRNATDGNSKLMYAQKSKDILNNQNEDLKWTVNPEMQVAHLSQSCEFQMKSKAVEKKKKTMPLTNEQSENNQKIINDGDQTFPPFQQSPKHRRSKRQQNQRSSVNISTQEQSKGRANSVHSSSKDEFSTIPTKPFDNELNHTLSIHLQRPLISTKETQTLLDKENTSRHAKLIVYHTQFQHNNINNHKLNKQLQLSNRQRAIDNNFKNFKRNSMAIKKMKYQQQMSNSIDVTANLRREQNLIIRNKFPSSKKKSLKPIIVSQCASDSQKSSQGSLMRHKQIPIQCTVPNSSASPKHPANSTKYSNLDTIQQGIDTDFSLAIIGGVGTISPEQNKSKPVLKSASRKKKSQSAIGGQSRLARTINSGEKTPDDPAIRTAIYNLVEEKGADQLQIMIQEKQERLIEIRQFIENEKQINIKLNQEKCETDMDTPRCYFNRSSAEHSAHNESMDSFSKRYGSKYSAKQRNFDERVRFSINQKSNDENSKQSRMQSGIYSTNNKNKFKTTKDWKQSQNCRVSITTQAKPRSGISQQGMPARFNHLNNVHNDSLNRWKIGTRNMEGFDQDIFRRCIQGGGVKFKEMQISSNNDESFVKLAHTFPIIVNPKGHIQPPLVRDSFNQNEAREELKHLQIGSNDNISKSESKQMKTLEKQVEFNDQMSPKQKLLDSKKTKGNQLINDSLNIRLSRLAESIQKPLNLPSLRKKYEPGENVTETTMHGHQNEVTVDEIVAQPLILDSADIFPSIDQEKELAKTYIFLLKQEGDLLQKWRQLIVKNSQQEKQAKKSQDTLKLFESQQNIKFEDSDLVEIYDRNPDENSERDQAIKERAIQKALSTLLKEDKYRFKAQESRVGDTQDTIKKNDSQDSIKDPNQMAGNYNLNFVLKESEESPKRNNQRETKIKIRMLDLSGQKSVGTQAKAQESPLSSSPRVLTSTRVKSIVAENQLTSITNTMTSAQNEDRKANGPEKNLIEFKHLAVDNSAISSPKLERFKHSHDVETTLYDYQVMAESHNTNQMRNIMNHKVPDDELDQIVKSISSQSRCAKTMNQSRLDHLPKLASAKNQFVHKIQPLKIPQTVAQQIQTDKTSQEDLLKGIGRDSEQLLSGAFPYQLIPPASTKPVSDPATRKAQPANSMVASHLQRKNLKPNPAITKYLRYSQTKSRKMNQTQSTRASIARKEKMIDQLVEQLCDMATINKDSLISSGISQQTTKGVQLQETIASGLSSTRAYSALQPNSSRQNDLELRRALKSEIDRHLRNLDGSQL